MTARSWGNYPNVDQKEYMLPWRNNSLPNNRPLLPFGAGRSYGDVVLTTEGTVVKTSRLNHMISFNEQTGILRCESGVTFYEILELCASKGWFLPVTPGTKFVSIGGVIANDIHGKNHHRAGTFGCHVRSFELLRSDNSRTICSPTENSKLFHATIGGLGLTGVITWAEIQLVKIPSLFVEVESIKFHGIDEFLHIAKESDTTHEFTVAWLDTSRKNPRGMYMRGNWAQDAPTNKPQASVKKPLAELPFFMPNGFVNIPLIKAFNLAYYHKQIPRRTQKTTHYDPYFYPLDILQYWNRLYGKRGFQSYQCVVPNEHGQGKEVIEKLLSEIHISGLASPLTVLKLFGEKHSGGMLSFPKPGINLLLDFPNVGPKLDALLHKLDDITAAAGGRVNPAKDAHLSAKHFQTMYPNWQDFSEYMDPAFTSDFWNRVTKNI